MNASTYFCPRSIDLPAVCFISVIQGQAFASLHDIIVIYTNNINMYFFGMWLHSPVKFIGQTVLQDNFACTLLYVIISERTGGSFYNMG